MDERSLEKNLKNIERETLALQTAHDIGPGLVRYYEYSGSSAENVGAYGLAIRVMQGERAWPFIRVLMRKRNDMVSETVMLWTDDQDGMSFEAYVYGLGRAICDWKIISTSRLEITEAEDE